MNVFDELDRIRGKGVIVTVDWGQQVNFIKLASTDHPISIRNSGEKFYHTLYDAILQFDEKYPELL